MTDDRRQRLVDVVAEAMALAPADRGAFVRGACRGDEGLEKEALALVAAGVTGFLGDPTLNRKPAGASMMTGSIVGAQVGDRVGRYRLLQQIGEGGFGVVFMAEQREPVQRQVALKILKAGMDTSTVVARFEQERQALAMMDHPGIARVLDGGVTEQGRPYFVMELVKGDPIVAHCEKQGLGMRARLELFAQTCRAVQHAHTKGVIHRDIKPGNVLVTMVDGRAVPKVIDFGIAKATGGRLTERTLFTEFRQMIGTPEYMSPEQADNAGVDIDARTDVYSLGVLLYELLTGSTPFDSKRLRSAAWGEMQRIIREEEPVRPSTRLVTLATGKAATEGKGQKVGEALAAGRTRAAALVRGDVDWIVMRCLEKDRARRYATADALGEDVQRHLDGEPVVAAPPSAAYKARKFIARHRKVAMAVVVVLGTLLAGAVGTAFGFVRALKAEAVAVQRAADSAQSAAKAREAEAKARENSAIADEVNELMTSMMARADRSKQGGRADVTVREVMDSAAKELEGRAQPGRVESMLARTIGKTYWQLGEYDSAERMLRMHATLEEKVCGKGTIEHGAGVLMLGGLLKKKGDLEGARRQYSLAGEIGAALGDAGAELGASAKVNEAVMMAQGGEPERAERTLREMLAGLDARGIKSGPARIEGTNNLAAVLFRRGEVAESRALYEESLRLRKAAGDEMGVVTALHNLGVMAYSARDYVKAAEIVREEVAAARKLFGDEHEQTASALESLGAVLGALDDRAGGEAALREALAIRRKVHKAGHPGVVGAARALGLYLVETGKEEEAEALLREAIEGMGAFMRATDPDSVNSRFWLAVVLDRRGEHALAAEVLGPALVAAEEGMKDGSRNEWMRHAVACLMGSVRVEIQLRSGESAVRENAEREMARALEGARRVKGLEEKMGPRTRAKVQPRVVGFGLRAAEGVSGRWGGEEAARGVEEMKRMGEGK